MQIAVLTFDGFNEIDSFVAAHILNRLRPQGWRALITSPDAVITSANGVMVHAERPLEFAGEADAVIICSGLKTSTTRRTRDCLGHLARSQPSAHWVAMFRCAASGQAWAARRATGMHRFAYERIGG